MGYWATSITGRSLQIFGDLNPDGTEMLWGDGPADILHEGAVSLITRLRAELGRFPAIEEVDQVKLESPEMTDAIRRASDRFAQDIGRPPTSGEITAGMIFVDLESQLENLMRRDIVVGDRIRWSIHPDDDDREDELPVSFYYIAEEIVEAIAEETIDGTHIVVFVVNHRGEKIGILPDAAYKVLPGDDTIERENELFQKFLSYRKRLFEAIDGEEDEDGDDGVIIPIYNRPT